MVRYYQPYFISSLFFIHLRQDEFEDQNPEWDFHLTVREAEPPQRPSILETSQKSAAEATKPAQPLKEQNYVNEVSAAPSAAVGVGKKELQAGESNRLSNGLDQHLSAVAPIAVPTVTTNHSPRSSALLQENRLSTLSNDSNSTPFANGLLTEELTSAGEESSMEPVVDDSAARYRHESAKSITEETRELDDYLNRTSVTSVLTESQIISMETSARNEGFERVGGVASREDLEEDEEDERGAGSLEVREGSRLGEGGLDLAGTGGLIIGEERGRLDWIRGSRG